MADTSAVARASQQLSFALQQNEELLSAITECLTLGRLNDAVSYQNRLQHNLVLLLQLGDGKPSKKSFRNLIELAATAKNARRPGHEADGEGEENFYPSSAVMQNELVDSLSMPPPSPRVQRGHQDATRDGGIQNSPRHAASANQGQPDRTTGGPNRQASENGPRQGPVQAPSSHLNATVVPPQPPLGFPGMGGIPGMGMAPMASPFGMPMNPMMQGMMSMQGMMPFLPTMAGMFAAPYSLPAQALNVSMMGMAPLFGMPGALPGTMVPQPAALAPQPQPRPPQPQQAQAPRAAGKKQARPPSAQAKQSQPSSSSSTTTPSGPPQPPSQRPQAPSQQASGPPSQSAQAPGPPFPSPRPPPSSSSSSQPPGPSLPASSAPVPPPPSDRPRAPPKPRKTPSAPRPRPQPTGDDQQLRQLMADRANEPPPKVWSAEEHQKAVEYALELGWSAHAQISARIKTKSRIQVRSHLSKYLAKLKRTAVTLGRKEDDFKDLIDKC